MIVKNQDKECKRVNDDEKETLRKYYLDNEMSELKKIANPIIKQRNFPMMEHDDLYSDARVLTVYELMIVTSLPKNWDIPNWASEHFVRQVVGEGIPPLLVKKIMQELININE